jgi:exodeoxyribonuclease VIII
MRGIADVFRGAPRIQNHPEGTLPVLDMGNLVHALALQPDQLEKEFSIEPEIPEGAFTTTATIRAFIDEYNAGLPPLLSADDIKDSWRIQRHPARPGSLGASVEETGQGICLYLLSSAH